MRPERANPEETEGEREREGGLSEVRKRQQFWAGEREGGREWDRSRQSACPPDDGRKQASHVLLTWRPFLSGER